MFQSPYNPYASLWSYSSHPTILMSMEGSRFLAHLGGQQVLRQATAATAKTTGIANGAASPVTARWTTNNAAIPRRFLANRLSSLPDQDMDVTYHPTSTLSESCTGLTVLLDQVTDKLLALLASLWLTPEKSNTALMWSTPIACTSRFLFLSLATVTSTSNHAFRVLGSLSFFNLLGAFLALTF